MKRKSRFLCRQRDETVGASLSGRDSEPAPGAAVSNALTHSGVIGKDGFRRFESGQYLSELGWYRRLYSLSQAF